MSRGNIKYLPNIWGAIALILCTWVVQILLVTGLYDLGIEISYGDPRGSLIVAFTSVLSVAVIVKLTGLKLAQLIHLSNNSVKSTVSILFPLILAFMLPSFYWFNDFCLLLTRLIPPDSQTISMLENMLSGGLLSFITVCITAPILEELLYRGIILRGLLMRHTPVNAILLSSIIFAAIHLNWAQAPVAFFAGLFLGWLYYKSRSLWPCIFAHAIQNTGSYILWIREGYKTEYNSLTINLLTLTLSLILLVILNRIFSSSTQEKSE